MSKQDNLKDYLTDLYQGIASKKPNASRNPQNFRREIESIETGITPTGDLSITKNGTYDVTNKASATVIVPIPSGYIKPSGSKTITENGTHNVKEFESVEVNVASGGGGECSGNHIIEVDTLPTENISRNDIYKMGDSYYKYSPQPKDLVCFFEGGTVMLFSQQVASNGGTLELIYTDNYESVTDPHFFMDYSTMTYTFYYDASRKDAFAYANGEWASVSLMLELSNGGVITDMEEITTAECYYILLDIWKKYDAVGNVTGTPLSYTVQTVDELPISVVDGSLAIVLRGGE
jgi:hypothetical protein